MFIQNLLTKILSKFIFVNFRLKYLEASIKETLRMRPPVREYYREIPGGGNLEIKNKKHYILPQATIIICDEFMHFSEKHFKNPFQFR